MIKHLLVIACCSIGIGFNALQAADDALFEKLASLPAKIKQAAEAGEADKLDMLTAQAFATATVGVYVDEGNEDNVFTVAKQALKQEGFDNSNAHTLIKKTSNITSARLLAIATRAFYFGTTGSLDFLNRWLEPGFTQKTVPLSGVRREDILASRAILATAHEYFLRIDHSTPGKALTRAEKLLAVAQNPKLFSAAIQEKGLETRVLEGVAGVESFKQLFDVVAQYPQLTIIPPQEDEADAKTRSREPSAAGEEDVKADGATVDMTSKPGFFSRFKKKKDAPKPEDKEGEANVDSALLAQLAGIEADNKDGDASSTGKKDAKATAGKKKRRGLRTLVGWHKPKAEDADQDAATPSKEPSATEAAAGGETPKEPSPIEAAADGSKEKDAKTARASKKKKPAAEAEKPADTTVDKPADAAASNDDTSTRRTRGPSAAATAVSIMHARDMMAISNAASGLGSLSQVGACIVM